MIIQFNESICMSDIQCHPNPFLVIHPLDDEPEQKVGSNDLPPLRMTRSVRISLFTLRAYLILMMLLLLYHVLDLAHVIP